MYWFLVFFWQDLVCVTIQAAYLVECMDTHTGQIRWQHLFQWLKDDKYEYKVPTALSFLPDSMSSNKTRKMHVKRVISSQVFKEHEDL